MSIDDFLDLMPATVTVEPLDGYDTYAGESYGASVSYRARVVYRNYSIRGPQGQTITARGVVWLAGTTMVGINDRLTLPDGTSPEILSVEKFPDESGDHHVKVYFG